jgi:hypothetical protein
MHDVDVRPLMKRRRFLKTSLASGVLAFPGASLLAARTTIATPPEGLRSLFGDAARIRNLGVAYLASCPDENRIDTLEKLCAGPGDTSLVASAIRRDFASGHVVTVDGWVLSRTEARHCALYAMLTSAMT